MSELGAEPYRDGRMSTKKLPPLAIALRPSPKTAARSKSPGDPAVAVSLLPKTPAMSKLPALGLAFAPRLSPVSLPMSMAMSLLPIPSPPKGPVPPARPKSPVPPVASAMLPLPMAIAMSPVPEVAV
jgi:hypothetical protein